MRFITTTMSAEGRRPEASAPLILAVDDDSGVLSFVAKALERRGFRVRAVDGAGAALEAVESQGLEPDLLLTDVHMPGLSGVELANALRERLPGLAVLLMTGRSCELVAPYALTPKPFSIAQLVEAVRRQLAERPAGGRRMATSPKA